MAAGRSPAGSADPEVLDCIHRVKVAEPPEYGVWDRYFHSEPGVQAIRNRAKSFATWLEGRVAEAAGRELRLVSVASGPAHEVGAYFRSHPEARVRAWCVDPSPRALERARTVCEVGGDRVEYVAENSVRHVPPAGASLVWSGGMLDQLGDRLVVVTLGRLWKALPEGARSCWGICRPRMHPGLLEVLADWAPLPRRAEDLVELARQAGIPAAAVRVGSEPFATCSCTSAEEG